MPHFGAPQLLRSTIIRNVLGPYMKTLFRSVPLKACDARSLVPDRLFSALPVPDKNGNILAIVELGHEFAGPSGAL